LSADFKPNSTEGKGLKARILGVVGIAFSILLFAGIVFSLEQGIVGAINAAKWDPTLPSSTKEVIKGLFLAAFVGGALSIGFTALFLFVRGGLKWSNVGLVIVLIVASLIWGGILVFVVPTWIAFVALVIGIGLPICALWRE
jgi:hypothetical protein